MSRYILPTLIILLLIYSIIKKNNTYNSFVVGAKNSFNLVLTSFPYIATIFIAVEIFQVSGLAYLFSDFVSEATSGVATCSIISSAIGLPPRILSRFLYKIRLKLLHDHDKYFHHDRILLFQYLLLSKL